MDVYNKIRKNFSQANEYSNNAIVQKIVRELLLNKSSDFINSSINKILNIGVRDISEPLNLYNKFHPNKIDVIDMVPPESYQQLTDNQYNINLLKLNFDKDLHLLDNDYNFIFSNMSLQWSNNLNSLLSNLVEKLDNNAVLAFSTLLSNNFHEISHILRINNMYTQENIIRLISEKGLSCLYKRSFYMTLRFDSFKKLINHLKITGVNTYTGSSTPEKISNIRNFYSNPNESRLTYHIGLFICYKE